jgi:hypothetical protein
VQDSIKDRIKKLRAEIAEISEANRQYMKSAAGTKAIGAAEHQRRLERLQQILDEMTAMTDWKKL